MGKVEGKGLKHFGNEACMKTLYVPELHAPRGCSSLTSQICSSLVSLLREDAKP